MQLVDEGPLPVPDWWRAWTETPADMLEAAMLVQAFDPIDRRLLFWLAERSEARFPLEDLESVFRDRIADSSLDRGIEQRVGLMNMMAVARHRERLVDVNQHGYTVSRSGVLVITAALRTVDQWDEEQRLLNERHIPFE